MDLLSCAKKCIPSPAARLAIAAIVVTSSILAIAYRQPTKFSGWSFGDAQTMMTLKNWSKDGIRQSYGLFFPQGWSPVTQLIDLPELRQHAHGISPGAAPGVGPRLLYTHYPPGYLYPLYAAYEMGFRTTTNLRVVPIFFSAGAVIFLFLTFQLWFGSWPAAIAASFYLFPDAYRNFAASLSNQPFDDFLRWLLIYLLVSANRLGADQHWQRRDTVTALTFFVLCLSSYDSTLFIVIFGMFYDLLHHRRIRPQWWAALVVIPLAAYALQLVQNSAYLGWAEALHDQHAAFQNKSNARGIADYISVFRLLIRLYHMSYTVLPDVVDKVRQCFLGQQNIALTVGAWALVSAVLFRHKRDLLLALSFLVCGSAYIFALPAAASMSYQPRQLLPFAAAIVAIAVRGGIDVSRKITALAKIDTNMRSHSKSRMLLDVAVASAIIAALVVLYLPELHNVRTPAQQVAIDISHLRTRYPKVVFNIEGFPHGEASPYVQGYPEVKPELEYLSDSLVLSFEKPVNLVSDLERLLALSKVPFSPILLVRDQAQIGAVKQAAKAGCADRTQTVAIEQSLALDLTETRSCW